MIYEGYKITVRCLDWEQIKLLDDYWNLFASYVPKEKIVGLGMNWSEDKLYFEYALGVIEDKETLNKISLIDFSKTKFAANYIKIKLPDLKSWQTYQGKANNLRKIYEQEIDCYERDYDYELEYIDSLGNIEIKIHYIDN